MDELLGKPLQGDSPGRLGQESQLIQVFLDLLFRLGLVYYTNQDSLLLLLYTIFLV